MQKRAKERVNLISFIGKEQRGMKQLETMVTKSNGWYEGYDFELQVRRETVRSTRIGSPVSQVLIELSGHSNGSGRVTKEVYDKFISLLINLINENTRISDVKILTDDRKKIAILLVDTALEGAKAFMEKLLNKFFLHVQTQLHLGYVNLIHSITVSVHPVALDESNQITRSKLKLKRLELAAIADSYISSDFDRTHTYGNTNGYTLNKTNDYSIQSPASLTLADSPEVKAPFVIDYISWTISQRVHESLKRILDITGALFGIIFFLPFSLIISAAIKATSKGPVLFKQRRIGYRGKAFTFLKFRTMKTDSKDQIHKDYIKKYIEGKNAEINNGSDEEPLFKLNNDPRVTKIGRFLRKTSLDELPQFLNVLGGSMSLVGPRPPIPYEVELYQPWHLRRIMETKPGITGLWQVTDRNKTTFDNMVRLDLRYVRNQSIFLDLKIILKTLAVMFNSKAGI